MIKFHSYLRVNLLRQSCDGRRCMLHTMLMIMTLIRRQSEIIFSLRHMNTLTSRRLWMSLYLYSKTFTLSVKEVKFIAIQWPKCSQLSLKFPENGRLPQAGAFSRRGGRFYNLRFASVTVNTLGNSSHQPPEHHPWRKYFPGTLT